MYIMREKEDYNALDLRDIIRILIKRIKLLIAFPIIFAIIGGVVSNYFINPVYEATTTIIVRQSNDSTVALSQVDVNLSKSLIYTYAEIIKSNTVIGNTKKALKLNMLDINNILVLPVKDTQILKIDVQNEDAELATNIANTLVEQFALEVVRITSTDNVAVVDYANVPLKPVKPNIFLNTVIAGMLGEMLITLTVFLLEYLDNSIKTEKDIDKYLDLPLLGTLPNFNQRRKETYEYKKVCGEGTPGITSD